MKNNVIRLNEEKLREMVSESVEEVLLQEGFFDNLKSAWDDTRKGYDTQSMIDRGTDGFKQQHDHQDAMNAMTNPISKMSNTAEEQSSEIYKQYQYYQTKANQLLSLYKKLNRQYGLVKQGTGKYVNANPSPMGNGIEKSRVGQTRFNRPNRPTPKARAWGME